MHHDGVTLAVKQGPLDEPVDEYVAIRRVKNVVERIASSRFTCPSAALDEMEVVITENCDRARAEPSNEAQHFERARPAIHEVADKPQAIPRRIEIDARKEPLERDKTTLYVADDVSGHRRIIRHD